MTVKVEDDDTATGGNNKKSDTATVEINVVEQNDPPVVTPASFTIPENSNVNTVVGTVTATDEDDPAQVLTFTIESGNIDDAFEIDQVTTRL